MGGVKDCQRRRSVVQNTPVTEVFINNLSSLQSYLSRFFHSTHDIEDVLQDAYIRAVEAEKVNQIQKPKAFLYKVCKNLAINHCNRAAQKLRYYIEDFEELYVLDSAVTTNHHPLSQMFVNCTDIDTQALCNLFTGEAIHFFQYEHTPALRW